MSKCSCGGEGRLAFEAVDLRYVESLCADCESVDKSFSTKKVARIDDRLVFAAGTESGEKGCLTVPVFGIPAKLCWTFEKFDINLPKVHIIVKFDISVGGIPAISRTVEIKCSNIAEPSECVIQMKPERAMAEFQALGGCDWECLIGCAPGCMSCGSNYWCWALCAGKCVIKCCL